MIAKKVPHFCKTARRRSRAEKRRMRDPTSLLTGGYDESFFLRGLPFHLHDEPCARQGVRPGAPATVPQSASGVSSGELSARSVLPASRLSAGALPAGRVSEGPLPTSGLPASGLSEGTLSASGVSADVLPASLVPADGLPTSRLSATRLPAGLLPIE